tara:strand:- start:211 stop:591 length:381 start_codon:yes stop_codon:yes gene_type:complete
MTTEISEEKTFDVSKYQIDNSIEERTLTVAETKEEFNVKIRPLSWARRNQIMSKCITWQTSGETSFDGDAFVRSCLRDMIVEAPWGRTTESFLLSIDARLGAALETLVPNVGESSEDSADEIKKDV